MAQKGAESGNPLSTYWQKRRFNETPEPRGKREKRAGWQYSIQKHAATRLHYDLRLELDGVLKSWAVTRGPSYDPADKRLAVRTEDHPVDYLEFEGTIPKGNYGAGTVLLWDRGTWEPVGDPHAELKKGKMAFHIYGQRLKGLWALIRMKPREGEKRENWLLIKERDELADPDYSVTEEAETSIKTGRDLDAIAKGKGGVATWTSKGGKGGGKAKARAKPPAFVAPQLATLVEDAPAGNGWFFEIKFDGYRAIAAVSGDQVALYTRSGQDWTARFAPLPQALADLDLDRVLLDGEIAVVDEQGRGDFSSLQKALSGEGGELSYFVFDLLAEAGKSLRDQSLRERKKRLQTLLAKAPKGGPVFFADHIEGGGEEFLAELCKRGFEGIIAKKADGRYVSGRTKSWLKIKCGRQQEFVIVGWTRSDKKDRAFSSLLVAVNENGKLRFAGRVGSGFSDTTLADLSKRFRDPRQRQADGRGRPAAGRAAAHPLAQAEAGGGGRVRRVHRRRQRAPWPLPRPQGGQGGKGREARGAGRRRERSAEEAARPRRRRRPTASPACACRIPSVCSTRSRGSPSSTSRSTWRRPRRACWSIWASAWSAWCAVRKGRAGPASSSATAAPGSPRRSAACR